jgi:hypothetical protein
MIRPMIMPGIDEPFDGLKNGEHVTLVYRALPEQSIPVFTDEAAVYKWQKDMSDDHKSGKQLRVFPDEELGFLFYADQGTRGQIVELKRVETGPTSWAECARVRLEDGTNREGLVPLMMIFNPKMEKLIEEEVRRLRDKQIIP